MDVGLYVDTFISFEVSYRDIDNIKSKLGYLAVKVISQEPGSLYRARV